MASESKGNKKRHSEAQKKRYKAHYHRLMGNKIDRLTRHVLRNKREVERKASRKLPRIIKIDHQVAARLKELVG